jgi:dynein heavy chain
VREPFKLKEVEKRYPFTYEDSMNSVLLQEMARFNSLIEIIKTSILTLIKTLEGKLVMTADIERML